MTSVLFLFVLILASAAGLSSPEVSTRSGRLRGRYVQTRDNRTVLAFLGIPFAQPPVGSLRFEPPQPVKPWSHVRLAVTQPRPCLQIVDLRGTEDCLYLNIYTPSIRETCKYPVLVFFFGGSFEEGSADGYTHEYLLDEDIVLVVVQYRLGLLGFLSTNDEVVPGNMGFKDQRCALRWLRDNVSGFGGDPDRVTIMGQSAGAVSVHYLMLFTAHEGLFRAGISQSASALVPWAFRPPVETEKMILVLAELSSCPKDSLGFVDCLKSRTGEEILILYDTLYKGSMYYGMEVLASQFLPLIGGVIEPECVTDRFIVGNPWHHNVSLPWLVGANNNEVLFVLIAELTDQSDVLFLAINILFDFYFPLLTFYQNSKADGLKAALELKKYYLKSLPISRSTLKPFANGLTHAEFTYGIYESILRADREHTYFYNLEYIGKNQVFPLPPDSRVGASHGDELFFFFPHPGNPFPNKQNYADEDDELLSRALVKMWTNFATCLDPTPVDTCELRWGSFSEGQNFLNITQKGMSMSGPFLEESMSFWRSQPFPFRDDYFETPKCKLTTTNNSNKVES